MASVARGIQIQLVVGWLLLAAVAVSAVAPSDILVSYSFDDNNIETGPDTFTVFEKAKGTVNLSPLYRFSGYSSVEIRDVAQDRDFPELQGYFALRKKGKLFAHFALMTTDSYETLNIALAGPQWFTLKKDGLGFWLLTRKGFLYHYSDSMPKKLFPLKSFTWYVVDVAYDIDGGTYDLTVHEEGQKKPVLALLDQKNASNQPFSSVDKFSFIGDLEDQSSVTYYVDDVVIGIDEKIVQLPFVAPGRRKLFVDTFRDYEKLLRQKRMCIPPATLEDFGVTATDVTELKRNELLEYLIRFAFDQVGAPQELQQVSEQHRRLLQAIGQWKEGCMALNRGDAERALKQFDQAAILVPGGRLYKLSAVLALSSLERWPEVDDRLIVLQSEWREDVRFSVALAMIGSARGEFYREEDLLRRTAELIPESESPEVIRRVWAKQLTPQLVDELKREFPKHWREYVEQRMVSEQYYYVFLWNNWSEPARRYALRMVESFKKLGLPVAGWLERAADAAFYAGNTLNALQLYEESLQSTADRTSVLLKLSDIHFLLGNLEKERFYREQIYGSLKKQTVR